MLSFVPTNNAKELKVNVHMYVWGGEEGGERERERGRGEGGGGRGKEILEIKRVNPDGQHFFTYINH